MASLAIFGFCFCLSLFAAPSSRITTCTFRRFVEALNCCVGLMCPEPVELLLYRSRTFTQYKKRQKSGLEECTNTHSETQTEVPSRVRHLLGPHNTWPPLGLVSPLCTYAPLTLLQIKAPESFLLNTPTIRPLLECATPLYRCHSVTGIHSINNSISTKKGHISNETGFILVVQIRVVQEKRGAFCSIS